MTIDHLRIGKGYAALLALALLLTVAVGNTFAVDAAVVDYSTDIATAVVGLVAGVAASIGAVFAIAALIRVTRKGATAALKAFGLIK